MVRASNPSGARLSAPVQTGSGAHPRVQRPRRRGVNHPQASNHHHHLALQPYVILSLLCYSSPLVPILSFSSPQASNAEVKERIDLYLYSPYGP
jgi:hypothetical protein